MGIPSMHPLESTQSKRKLIQPSARQPVVPQTGTNRYVAQAGKKLPRLFPFKSSKSFYEVEEMARTRGLKGWRLNRFFAEQVKGRSGDRRFVLEAVKSHGWLLKYADARFKNNLIIVMAAVSRHGWALKFASAEIKKYRRIVEVAVKKHGWALGYADVSLRKDRRFILKAMKIPPIVLTSKDPYLARLRFGRAMTSHMNRGSASSCRWRITDRSFNPRVLLYAHPSVRKDKKVVLPW